MLKEKILPILEQGMMRSDGQIPHTEPVPCKCVFVERKRASGANQSHSALECHWQRSSACFHFYPLFFLHYLLFSSFLILCSFSFLIILILDGFFLPLSSSSSSSLQQTAVPAISVLDLVRSQCCELHTLFFFFKSDSLCLLSLILSPSCGRFGFALLSVRGL